MSPSRVSGSPTSALVSMCVVKSTTNLFKEGIFSRFFLQVGWELDMPSMSPTLVLVDVLVLSLSTG